MVQQKQEQTARGRVLAAGDVDPAAGSRDEPTRLPVEAPIEGLRYKYTRVLFLKSNKGVPPLAPDFSDDLKKGPRVTPKDVKKTLQNLRAPKKKQGAQTIIRLHRRSPNAVCHFLRKLKISLKMSSFWRPFWVYF